MKFKTEIQPNGLVMLVIDYEKRDGIHEDHLLLTPGEVSQLEFVCKGIYAKAKPLYKPTFERGSPIVKGKVAEVKRGPLTKASAIENLAKRHGLPLPKAVAQKELGKVLKQSAIDRKWNADNKAATLAGKKGVVLPKKDTPERKNLSLAQDKRPTTTKKKGK